MGEFFSDREEGALPRTEEDVPEGVWGGIVSMIDCGLADGSFGAHFPEVCPDGNVVCGCDRGAFFGRAVALVPALKEYVPFRASRQPAAVAPVMDLLEFCYESIGKPVVVGVYHDHAKHNHYRFDVATGKAEFRSEVNRLFARNGLAYEMSENGRVVRLVDRALGIILHCGPFATGDKTLDDMLEASRSKFVNPDPAIRLDALKDLWDAWERLKTLEPGKDKNESAGALLNKATVEPNSRKELEKEALSLTTVGNSFMIRHTEVGKTPVTQLFGEYLFCRLYSLVWFLLKATGRLA